MRAGMSGVVTVVALLAGLAPAWAQQQPGSGTTPVAGQGLRAFALWLEDADVLQKGWAVVGVGGGVWRTVNGQQWDVAFDAGYGITDRVQVSFAMPYYQAKYDDGFQASGRGDTYLWAKIKLFDASEHAVGLAVAPLVEILGDASLADPALGLSRVNWALPVSVQVGTGPTRVYGTAGYFSRGAVFAAGAVERTLTDRFTLSATLQFTHSMHDLTGTDSEALPRSRVDATIGGSVMFAPNVGAYASIGRTISSSGEDGATLIFNTGLTVAFDTRPKPPPAK